MPLLPHPDILDIHGAAVNGGIAPSRSVLFAGVAPAILASLPLAADPSAQVLSDLDQLNRMHRLVDGTVPLERWLQNAMRLVGPGAEANVFDRALGLLPERSLDRTVPRRLYPLVLGGDLVRRASYESDNPAAFDQETVRLADRRIRRLQALLAAANVLIWAGARVALALSGATTLVVVGFGVAATIVIATTGVVFAAARTVIGLIAAKGGAAGVLNVLGFKLGSGGTYSSLLGQIGLASGVGLATGTVAVPRALVLHCEQRQDIAACLEPCADGKGDARSCFYLGRAYGNVAFDQSGKFMKNEDVEIDGVLLPENVHKAARLLRPLCVASKEPFQQDACVALVDAISPDPSLSLYMRAAFKDKAWARSLKQVAKEVAEAACRQGRSQYACVRYAQSLGRPGEEATHALFEQACAAGDPYGCLETGADLWMGFGVRQDRGRAGEHYEKARLLFEQACRRRCLAGGNANDTTRGRDCWWAAGLWSTPAWAPEQYLELPIFDGQLLAGDAVKAASFQRQACEVCAYAECAENVPPAGR